MVLFFFLFAALLYSIFAAFKSAFRGAAHYWGVRLASNINISNPENPNRFIEQSFKSINVHGLQQAITTWDEKLKQIISVFLNIAFLVAGTHLFNWKVALIILLGILIMKNLIRHLFPDQHSELYRHRIIRKLEREARFYHFLHMEKKEQRDIYFANELKTMD